MRRRLETPAPMSHWPVGGNWEGGYTDTQGQRWWHAPYTGWERVGRRHPCFATPRDRASLGAGLRPGNRPRRILYRLLSVISRRSDPRRTR